MQPLYSHQTLLLLQVIPSCRNIIWKWMSAARTPPKKFWGKSKRNSHKKIGSDIAATTMKNAKNGLFSIIAPNPMFLPQITTGMNSTKLQTQEAAKHPHCIRNTAFAKAQHRRNRGGICGKTYGNGFDVFSCCNRQFAISSVGFLIILSSYNSA